MPKTIIIDEYMVIDTHTGRKRWVVNPPKWKPYEVVVRIYGKVKLPDSMLTVNFGEIVVAEPTTDAQVAEVQAKMG